MFASVPIAAPSCRSSSPGIWCTGFRWGCWTQSPAFASSIISMSIPRRTGKFSTPIRGGWVRGLARRSASRATANKADIPGPAPDATGRKQPVVTAQKLRPLSDRGSERCSQHPGILIMTLTPTLIEVVLAPESSIATAVSVWSPASGRSQVKLYGRWNLHHESTALVELDPGHAAVAHHLRWQSIRCWRPSRKRRHCRAQSGLR